MLKKFKVLLVIASLSITLSLMSNTYSRYVATSEGNFAIEFAKWQLLVNGDDITNQTTNSFNLNPTIISNENIADDKIAPSSEGYFDVEINPENVDVSFKYTINLEMTNNIDDLVITRYAFLPDEYIEGSALSYNYLDRNENSISKEIKYGDSNYMIEKVIQAEGQEKTTRNVFKPIKIRVFFEWIEGTVDYKNDTTGEIEHTIIETMDNSNDTEIGINAANDINSEFSITANIHFEQIIN